MLELMPIEKLSPPGLPTEEEFAKLIVDSYAKSGISPRRCSVRNLNLLATQGCAIGALLAAKCPDFYYGGEFLFKDIEDVISSKWGWSALFIGGVMLGFDAYYDQLPSCYQDPYIRVSEPDFRHGFKCGMAARKAVFKDGKEFKP